MNEKAKQVSEEVYGKRRRWLGVTIVLVVALLVAALVLIPKSPKEQKQADVAPVNVRLMVVKPQAGFVDEFLLPGVVEPNLTVTVSAEVDGRVEKVHCIEGRPCKAGNPLISLNGELLGAEVERAKALIEQFTAQVTRAGAQRDLDRYELESVQRLHGRGAATDFALNKAKSVLAVSEAAVQEAIAGLSASEAVLKSAQANLNRTKIAVPVTGVLDRVLVEEGEYVSAGTPVARIVDVEKVRVVVAVPEQDVPYLRLGEEQKVFPDIRRNGQPLRGRIDYVSRSADEASRTTRTEILIDNVTGVLQSGRIVSVLLRRRVLRDVIMIPLASVIPLEDTQAVYVARDGKAERRQVELGFFKGQNVRVLRGLRAGDQLLIQGHRHVAPGQAIRVVPDDPQTSRPAPQWSARPQR